MQPIVGITGSRRSGEHTLLFKDDYVRAVQRAGGMAVLLPPTTEESLLNHYIELCQGILFTGGGDFDPIYWDEEAAPESGEIDPVRDKFELNLAAKAMHKHRSVLGICRGSQLLNVAAGGSLWQDVQSTIAHAQKAPRYHPIHAIFIEPGSRLAGIMQATEIRVNSFHHQAVKRLGSGFNITAMAGDGTIEAIERPDSRFCIGVQWHPECMQDIYSARLFKAFVDSLPA